MVNSELLAHQCSLFTIDYSPFTKKIASDGNRRPVLTSETTKRKKVSNMSIDKIIFWLWNDRDTNGQGQA